MDFNLDKEDLDFYLDKRDLDSEGKSEGSHLGQRGRKNPCRRMAMRAEIGEKFVEIDHNLLCIVLLRDLRWKTLKLNKKRLCGAGASARR